MTPLVLQAHQLTDFANDANRWGPEANSGSCLADVLCAASRLRQSEVVRNRPNHRKPLQMNRTATLEP